jgi:hypothetical protein
MPRLPGRAHALVLLLTLLGMVLVVGAVPVAADDPVTPPPVEPPQPPDPPVDDDLVPLPPEYDGGGRRCDTPRVPDESAGEPVSVWVAPAPTTCPAGTLVLLPVQIPEDVTAHDIFVWQVTLEFDPAVLEPVWVVPEGTLSAGWALNRQARAGRLWAGAAGLHPLRGSGTLVEVVFRTVGNPGDQTDLTFSELLLNGGDPAATPHNGRIVLTESYTVYMPLIAS